MEVLDAAGETVFERDGGEWLRDGARVRYEPVSDLLYALTGVEADSTSDDPVAGEPALTLVLGGDEDDVGETLNLYVANGTGARPARVDGRQVTLLLGEAAIADLELKLAEARSASGPEPAVGELEPIGEDL